MKIWYVQHSKYDAHIPITEYDWVLMPAAIPAPKSTSFPPQTLHL